MARWITLAAMLGGFALTLAARGPGALAIGLLLTLGGLFGFVFALAAHRISSNARPEAAMASGQDLARLRRRPNPRPPES